MGKKFHTAKIIIEYCVASCFEFFSVIPESYPEEIISYILAGAVLGLEYLHGNKRIHRVRIIIIKLGHKSC